MSSSQGSFSSSLPLNQSQNHRFTRQVDGAIYEFRLVTPADRTKQVTNLAGETSVRHITALPASSYLPSSSSVSSAGPSRQTGFPPFPEDILNAPRPNLRRRQANQATERSQIIPEEVTIYGGAGEAERQAVNQRLQVQQQRPDQARGIPPRVLI